MRVRQRNAGAEGTTPRRVRAKSNVIGQLEESVRAGLKKGRPNPDQETLEKRRQEISKYLFAHVHRGKEEESFKVFMESTGIRCEKAKTPSGDFYYRMPADSIEYFDTESGFQHTPGSGWFGAFSSVDRKGWSFFVKINRTLAMEFMWERFKWEPVCGFGRSRARTQPQSEPVRTRHRHGA